MTWGRGRTAAQKMYSEFACPRKRTSSAGGGLPGFRFLFFGDISWQPETDSHAGLHGASVARAVVAVQSLKRSEYMGILSLESTQLSFVTSPKTFMVPKAEANTPPRKMRRATTEVATIDTILAGSGEQAFTCKAAMTLLTAALFDTMCWVSRTACNACGAGGQNGGFAYDFLVHRVRRFKSSNVGALKELWSGCGSE